MNPRTILLVGAVMMLAPARPEARTWKEAGTDRTLEGEFTRKEADKVVIRRANGTSVKVPLVKLSPEDRDYVEEMAAAGEAAAPDPDEFRWETDFKVAKQRAKDEKKSILVDFTGSDWCGWCIKLKREVFDQPEFQKYARKHLVMLELDFPRKKELPEKLKEQNEELAREFGVRGYPTILLLNRRGREIARTGYQEGGPGKYVEHLKELLD